MTAAGHDTLVHRLAMMLLKLNQGDSLEPRQLAEEFGVNLRTVQRDLNERFAYLPLQKTDGRYRLEQAFLGKLSTRDIERFASLAGVRGLFPSFSDDFLRDIFDARLQGALLVRGHHYEDLAGRETAFKQLEQAIVARCTISFRYRKDDVAKLHAIVEPYKLVNHKGIWYLAGKESGKLKTFAFTNIEALLVSDTTFAEDPAVAKTLVEDEGIWLGGDSIEVVLKVSREVASYFSRRAVLVNQTIVKELEDGGLIVSTKARHANEVMPQIRYWIPHLRIISPEGMQASLEAELSAYVQGNLPTHLALRTSPNLERTTREGTQK
jgi:predicted DNA-binding transcriptional regulator YafY